MNTLADSVDVDLITTLSGIFTALATIVLAVLTWVLARATKAMAVASSQPIVVASLEENVWSVSHFDLVVENTGSAPAFDVQIAFDPPLPFERNDSERPVPFQNLSIVRPGQVLRSYVSDFPAIQSKVFRVTSSWRRYPRDKERETLSYDFDMKSFEGVSFLGQRSPEVQIAREIKHIRDDWKSMAGGTRRLKVDVFSSQDRCQIAREELEDWEKWKAQQEGDAT